MPQVANTLQPMHGEFLLIFLSKLRLHRNQHAQTNTAEATKAFRAMFANLT
jgi:hypothetical protein